MELLRRALLIGCVLPALWLFRLAPLDALVSIVPVDFALQQARERESLAATATDAERRRASLPLSVYIEEYLQYNVFSAAGPAWQRFLSDIDARAAGAAPVFLRADAEPITVVGDRLAAGGGTTYISMSRSGGDAHYRIERHTWTRNDFAPGSAFHGAPVPPVGLLYPFRMLGFVAAAVGLLLFVLLPSRTMTGSPARVTRADAAMLGIGLAAFALPLVAVGGSVQALTRAPLLVALSWIAAVAMLHRFAGPERHAPDPLTPAGGDRLLFVREGFVFLVIAFGPTAFLVSTSVILWNR